MTQFSSRPPFNDDPHPWVVRGGIGRASDEIHNNPAYAQYHTSRDPRPEYDRPQHNPTSPILAEFRDKVAGSNPYWSDIWDSTMEWLDHANPWDHYCSTRGLTAAHIDHAREVLARLASLTKEPA